MRKTAPRDLCMHVRRKSTHLRAIESSRLDRHGVCASIDGQRSLSRRERVQHLLQTHEITTEQHVLTLTLNVHGHG